MQKTKSEKTQLSLILIALFIATALSYAKVGFSGESNGIVNIKSAYSVSTTINRLEHVLKQKGMVIFKRINHSAGAKKAGMKLRPTELLVFGNPKAGTPLMLCSQSIALDLPQKALAYKDENGQVWLSYNDPLYLAKRHAIKNCAKPLQKISHALAKFSKAATQ